MHKDDFKGIDNPTITPDIPPARTTTSPLELIKKEKEKRGSIMCMNRLEKINRHSTPHRVMGIRRRDLARTRRSQGVCSS